ncbi:MAG: hypothetical protein ABIX01_03080 [Chitinophagaceae bacterium]
MNIRTIILCLLFYGPTLLFAQQYFGGNGNGVSSKIKTGTSLGVAVMDSLYNGGNGNGYTMLFSSTNYFGTGTADTLYNGGIGRGEKSNTALLDLSTCGNLYKWNGIISNTWAEPKNWDCGVIPGINCNVLIPSGLARYPTLVNTVEIKSLTIQNGASVTVLANKELKINGR